MGAFRFLTAGESHGPSLGFTIEGVPACLAVSADDRTLQDKVALFVCDFTPVEYDAYFDEMLQTLSRRGLVICSQFSPVVGLLRGGKYDAMRRDLRAGRQAVFNYLRAKLTV